MADTGHALLAAIDAMTSDAYFRRAVLRHCGDIYASAATTFNAAIHPHDPMLVHSLREHRDAGAAFSQYFAIAQQQHAAAMQVMRAAFGGSASDLDVLDFACGHGRLLRFLALSVPPERIFASDLQAEAIAFVRDAFGVRVLPSHEDPQRFDPGRRFDFIWVASLFSHLPQPLFRAWLARLLALLTPRGVLAFSVRDAGLMSDATQATDSGFVYLAHSENAELATDIYGTTYADEAFCAETAAKRGRIAACAGRSQMSRIFTSSPATAVATFPRSIISGTAHGDGSTSAASPRARCISKAGPLRSTTGSSIASRSRSTERCTNAPRRFRDRMSPPRSAIRASCKAAGHSAAMLATTRVACA